MGDPARSWPPEKRAAAVRALTEIFLWDLRRRDDAAAMEPLDAPPANDTAPPREAVGSRRTS